MTENKIKTIKGGWRNVPEGWYTKTQLNKMGLKPAGEAVGQVWSYHDWVFLYDIKDTKEKRKPSERQLEALERARKRKIELEEIRLKEEQQAMEEAYRREQEAHQEYWFNVFNSWYERDFVVLDTETTDLDGEIIEISIIDRNGNVLFDSLIKPKGKISDGAFAVHGIGHEMLEDKPTWADVFPQITEILKDRLVLIYNDSFDVSMIYNSCYLWGIEPLKLETDCVMRSFADFWQTRWVKLAEASGNWGQSHRAIDDCFDTLKVIKGLWKECEIGVNV